MSSTFYLPFIIDSTYNFDILKITLELGECQLFGSTGHTSIGFTFLLYEVSFICINTTFLNNLQVLTKTTI